MGSETLTALLRGLTGRHKVLLLGGLAVIAHGHSRATKDVDLWLDPLDSSDDWAAALLAVLAAFPHLQVVRLPHESPLLTAPEIAAAVSDDRMIRVLGLECPLDLFRHPNGLELEDFSAIWARAKPQADGVYLPDPIDLLLSKDHTGRAQDVIDQAFLEEKIRKDFGDRVAVATLEEARSILDRFADHVIGERALTNPNPEVRALARSILGDLAAQGDWFSREALERNGPGIE